MLREETSKSKDPYLKPNNPGREITDRQFIEYSIVELVMFA